MKTTLLLISLFLASFISEACSCAGEPEDLFSTTSDYTQEYLVVFDYFEEIQEEEIGGVIVPSSGDIGHFKIITSINDRDGNIDGDSIEVRGGISSLCQRGVRFNKNDTLIISVIKSPEYYLSICRESYIKIENGAYNGETTTEVINKLQGTITNIYSTNLNNSISIYPNPAKDKLTIESFSSSIKNIEVLNSEGNAFISLPKTSTFLSTIPLDKLNSGLYIVRITTENGIITKTISKK